jgi:hypothetical protein
LEEDDADRKVKAVRQHTLIKSRWIVPLLLKEIAEKPNMSNAEMKHVVSAYVKENFITSSLLQNARTMARDEIFGDPATNVFFANGLVEKMKECGVDVEVLMKDWQQGLRMLEHVVLSDHMRKNKAEGKLMMKAEKIEFVSNWKLENKEVLEDGGLGEPKLGAVLLKFFSGILSSILGAQKAVPFLQQVFQADACHMSFGKYTLHSFYGTTANSNTYPVAFGILFRNEDKEGLMDFWDFAKLVHRSIDDTRVTIITDQAKGLRQSIAEVIPSTGHFHCSYHRRQNILKFVRGGTQKYSCLWLYNKLMKANTQCEIEQIKHKHAPFMNEKALK